MLHIIVIAATVVACGVVLGTLVDFLAFAWFTRLLRRLQHRDHP